MRVPVIYNRTSIRLPSPSTGGGAGGAGSLLSSLYRWPYLAELLRSGGGGGGASTNTGTSTNNSALLASLANLSHSVLNNVSASSSASASASGSAAVLPSGSRYSSSVSSLSRVASTHPHHLPTSHHHSYGKCVQKNVLKSLYNKKMCYPEMPVTFDDVTWTLDKHKTDAHDAFFYIEAICNAWFSFEIATRFLVSVQETAAAGVFNSFRTN